MIRTWFRRWQAARLVQALERLVLTFPRLGPRLGPPIAEALERAERFLASGGESYRLRLALGQAYEIYAGACAPVGEAARYFQRARQHYEAALRVAPAHGELTGLPVAVFPPDRQAELLARWYLGRLLVAEHTVRDIPAAREHLAAVVAAVPGYHPAYYYLGEALVLAQQFDQAEAVWRQARALPGAPTDLLDKVLTNLPLDQAHHASRRGDWATVVRALDRPEVRPRLPAEALRLLGDAYAAQGDLNAARRAWEEAAARSPKAVGLRKRLRHSDPSQGSHF